MAGKLIDFLPMRRKRARKFPANCEVFPITKPYKKAYQYPQNLTRDALLHNALGTIAQMQFTCTFLRAKTVVLHPPRGAAKTASCFAGHYRASRCLRMSIRTKRPPIQGLPVRVSGGLAQVCHRPRLGTLNTTRQKNQPLTIDGTSMPGIGKRPAKTQSKSPPKNGLRHLLPIGWRAKGLLAGSRDIGTRFATKVASSRPSSKITSTCHYSSGVTNPHTCSHQTKTIYFFTKQLFGLFFGMDFFVLTCILYKVGA